MSPVPEATTLKVTEAPAAAVLFEGWVVIVGLATAVTVTPLLVLLTFLPAESFT